MARLGPCNEADRSRPGFTPSPLSHELETQPQTSLLVQRSMDDSWRTGSEFRVLHRPRVGIRQRAGRPARSPGALDLLDVPNGHTG